MRLVYVKLTDKYIYTYTNNKIKRYTSKYILNGKVENPNKLTEYLKKVLNIYFFNKKYIFILDTLLCSSDIFVYKYVFESIGLLNYKIINDLDLIKDNLNESSIVIFNWSSSINYCYKLKDEIIVNKYNKKIIDNLNKKYIILAGDYPITTNFKTPIFEYETKEKVIFNFL